MSSGVTPARKCSRGDARCGARLGADLLEVGATTVLSITAVDKSTADQ